MTHGFLKINGYPAQEIFLKCFNLWCFDLFDVCVPNHNAKVALLNSNTLPTHPIA